MVDNKFQSTKLYSGYTTCFRQWRADNTLCKFLHGYSVSFKVWYEGELDMRNWVMDFGCMKRTSYNIDGKNPKEYLEDLLDHTVIVSKDDPDLYKFKELALCDVIRLRVVPHVGAERFAEFIYDKLNPWVINETNDRVKIVKIEFFENKNNSGIYIPENYV